VLLYELLTGTTPLQRERLREAALSELVRLIKEEEPPRPSVWLSSSDSLPKIAAARKTEPRLYFFFTRKEWAYGFLYVVDLHRDHGRHSRGSYRWLWLGFRGAPHSEVRSGAAPAGATQEEAGGSRPR
jgi:hypothetical protein